MKSSRVLISTLLVLITLSFAACNRTSDEQKDQNTTQQNATHHRVLDLPLRLVTQIALSNRRMKM